jgi:hypothetical protein
VFYRNYKDSACRPPMPEPPKPKVSGDHLVIPSHIKPLKDIYDDPPKPQKKRLSKLSTVTLNQIEQAEDSVKRQKPPTLTLVGGAGAYRTQQAS